MSTWGNTCPRRMLEFGPWKREEGLDEFHDRRSYGNQQLLGKSCSFCGALDPDVVMAGLRDGTLYLSGSDKSYKTYVGRGDDSQVAKFYFAHLSRAHCEELLKIWGEHPERVKLYVRPWLPAMSEDAPDWLVGA